MAIVFIACCTIWIGVVAACVMFAARARTSEDDEVRARYVATFGRISWFVGLPAAIGALSSGLQWATSHGVTFAEDWWFGTAVASWVAAFVGSTMLRAPRLAAAVREVVLKGAGDEEVRWRIRQVDLTSRGELVLLAAAAVVIYLKPA